MNRKFCFTLVLVALFFVSGCSSIHNSIGADKPVSDLRAEVEAPAAVAASNAELCVKPEVVIDEPKIVVAPDLSAPDASYRARLYFMLDSVEFIPESKAESEKIYQAILDRHPREVVIIGHTDTSASHAYNEALSMRRAHKVRQQLIDFGVPADVIQVDAFGEHQMLVTTPDETVEVKNRRVEIEAR